MKIVVLDNDERGLIWQSARQAGPELEFIQWSESKANLPTALKLANKPWTWRHLSNKLGANTLILKQAADKLRYTPMAVAADWQVMWLETVDNLSEANNIRLADLSKQAMWLNPSMGSIKARLIYGWEERSCCLLRPLLDWRLAENQLASQVGQHRSWSSSELLLGVWQDLSDLQYLEFLFKLAVACTNIGLRLRLVIFGEGVAREQARWLADKMSLAAQVQFVAVRQAGANFSGLDALILNNKSLTQEDYLTAMQSLAVGTPVWGVPHQALADVFDTDLGYVTFDWSKFDDQVASLRAWAKEVPARRQFVNSCQRWAVSNCDTANNALAWRQAFALN